MVGARHPFLPIPVIPEHTRYIKAGAVTIGVGYRLLNDKIADEYLTKIGVRDQYSRQRMGYQRVDDGGVSIFVFEDRNGELLEHFRLDIFDAQPHYHYVFQKENAQERVLLDPIVTGDAEQWALWCLRERLPKILEKVGEPMLAKKVDRRQIESALPDVVQAIRKAETDYRRAAGKA